MSNETKLNEIKNEVKEARELLEKAEFKLENYKETSRLPIPEGIHLSEYEHIMFKTRREELDKKAIEHCGENCWEVVLQCGLNDEEQAEYNELISSD